MSADDWLECPFCEKERDELLDELFKKLTREKYELLLSFVREFNLNVNGIKYIIDNEYLENGREPEIEDDMRIETLRVDYTYDITYKECDFSILFKCEVCGFEEYLEQNKKLNK